MAVILRTCIGCHRVKEKDKLIRIVKNCGNNAIVIDSEGKKNGRGAYICPRMDCVNKAVNTEKLSRSLKISPGLCEKSGLDILKELELLILNNKV